MVYFNKHSVKPAKILAEFQVFLTLIISLQVFDVSLFSEGDFVNISGSSKGEAFLVQLKNILLYSTKNTWSEIRIDMLGLLVLHLILLGFSWEKCLADTGIKLSVLKN